MNEMKLVLPVFFTFPKQTSIKFSYFEEYLIYTRTNCFQFSSNSGMLRWIVIWKGVEGIGEIPLYIGLRGSLKISIAA